MFGFVTPVGAEALDPLTNAVAAEVFLRTLPRDDPIAAQKAICGALGDTIGRASPSTDRLNALLALDPVARVLVDGLLVNCVARSQRHPGLRAKSPQAAVELCRHVGRAFGQFLRPTRANPAIAAWSDYLPYLVLRLFQYRQTELLLRPFADERSNAFAWRELHEAYRFAQSRELLHDKLPINRSLCPSVSDTTLEREYIHALLQDVISGGQLSLYDALWASKNLPRWTRAAALQPDRNRGGVSRFVVDPDADAGLKRSNGEATGSCLFLDTTPVLESIRDEIEALRENSGRPHKRSSTGRGRQLKLLRKVSGLCAAERPVIPRRGEREAVALTVEVAVGMAQILAELCDQADDEAASSSPTPPQVTRSQLTMVDRSDSGCRLHGPTLGASPVLPGALVAFREDAGAPWTLAVVRRVKKRLAGKRVEMGVEYLGRDPRRIVVAGANPDTSNDDASASAGPRFAALYLPESAKYPVLPIKTMILPACGLAPECRLSVRSRTDLCTIQLKEPLEEQVDFIWSPFEILDRWQRLEPAPDAAEPTAKAS